MARDTQVLALEGDVLRALRWTDNGRTATAAARGAWPLAAPPPEASDAPDAASDGAAADNDAAAAAAPPLVTALTAAAATCQTHEFVLALPLAQLLVDVVRVPVAAREELVARAQDALAHNSPFPDETFRVATEIVAETDTEIVAVCAALPEAAARDLGDALDAAKVRIVRTDATALGRVRTLWPQILAGGPAARRLVLMDLDDGWDFLLLDDDAPVVLRGLGHHLAPDALGREVMLGLIRAETAAGARELAEIVVITTQNALVEDVHARLARFAPVRLVTLAPEDAAAAGTEGVAQRSCEGATFDVTPEPWDQALKESRFRRRLVTGLAVAGGLWLAVMGVLWGVPAYFNWQTSRQADLSRRHNRAYTDVYNMRARVRLVQRYSDHACGALEMLKVFADRQPEGVTLTQLTYKRGESIRVSAEAQQPTDAYAFKDALARVQRPAAEAAAEDAEEADGERLFAEVVLSEVKQSRGGINKFDIEAKFATDDEEAVRTKGGR